ncbi:MAG TPA: hypothetical protein GXZ98_00235 [Firmicutes bacterium]|nr:hypothetical protein [Bacillota bacterium]
MAQTKRDVTKEHKYPLRWLGEQIFSEDVYRRVGGYLLCGLLFFALAWVLGYFILGEGAFKNTLLVDKIFGVKGVTDLGSGLANRTFTFFKWEFETAELVDTWGNTLLVTGKIFVHHLLIVLFFIFFLNRFKIGRFPLALFYFLLYSILTGFVVGTNSYAYPAQGFTRLGALVTFLRFGLWVWFSYTLLLASTANWTWLQSSSLLDSSWEKAGKFWCWPRLYGDDKEVFIFGLLFLLVSSFAEARLVVYYGQHFL